MHYYLIRVSFRDKPLLSEQLQLLLRICKLSQFFKDISQFNSCALLSSEVSMRNLGSAQKLRR